MVFKKPYAFVIKHFQLIHLVLLIPMIYLITQTGDVASFFSSYVRSNYTLSSNVVLDSLSGRYINVFMYLAIIAILVINVLVAWVLQLKDKPTKLYKYMIIYYGILFVCITVCLSFFISIENGTDSETAIRIARDIIWIIHYAQYIFVALVAVRAIGFNIKQFNFKSDIKELEISSEDSEEFEFVIGVDTDDAKRKLRRFLREAKYYYKENKFIIIALAVIAIGVLGTIFYTSESVVSQSYNENSQFAFGYFQISINSSYVSSLNMTGDVIKDGKAYVIINASITNAYRENHELNYTNMLLQVGNTSVSPTILYGQYFLDLGNPYDGSYIKGSTTNDYILVYEIDSKYISSSYTLKVYSSYDSSVGGIGAVNKEVKLKPNVISDKISESTVNKGTNITLSDTTLLNTKVSIVDYEITNRYAYTYDNCISTTNCYSATGSVAIDYIKDGNNKTLLVLDYTLSLDEDSTYMSVTKSYSTFFSNFLTIKYVIDDTEYYADFTVANTSEYSDKLILKIDKDINKADELYAIINVRNKKYSVKLL